MTTKELADILTPQVREAVDRSKDSILAGMPPFKRFWVRALWPIVLSVGVPTVTRIDIEFLVSKYKQTAKPYVGVYLEAWIKLNKDSDVAVLKQIAEYLSVVETDPSQFLNVVQQVLLENENV